jgi:tetratricopeptide (TPR) repeat protein
MKRWALLIALALAVPAAAEQKPEKAKPVEKRAAASPEELMRQAEQKAQAGDADGAIELLRKAAEMPASTGEPSLRLGRLLEAKQQLDAAMDAYTAAGGKLTGAGKAEALARLSLAQETRGKTEATATAEAAAAADASGVWPTIALSRARARAKQADEAIALAQKAVAGGGGAAASSALGFAQEAKGDLAAAEAAYRAALSGEGDHIAPSVGLARVLRKTNRAAEAEPILAKALADSPGAVEAYKESARVKLALHRAADAVGDAATAAALAETDADAQRLVSEVTVGKALDLLAMNQAEQAIRELTELRDKSPDFVPARIGLAKALLARRQADPAIVELTKAVELDPSSAEAQYQLGRARHLFKQDAAGAVSAYEKAVAAEPANVEYRTGLGAALVDQKQFDRAATELQKVTSSAGYDRAEGWVYLGGAHLGAKRYKDAIAALEKGVAKAPDSAQAEAYLAWSYFGLKDSANFKKHAGRAKSLGLKEPTLLSYLARVEAGEPIK